MQDINTHSQFATIETSELSDVTGGGLFGAAFKLARKAAPYVEKAVPFVKDKAVDVAKWTGIPAAVGGGAAWIKHQFSH
jgi:selenophosphate synthase